MRAGLKAALFGNTFYPGATVALDFLAQRYRAPGVGNFVGAFSALPGLTVTRASTGYAANSDGSLVLFPAGVARITNQGLLVEEARTNFAWPSNDPTNANWALTGAPTVSLAAGRVAPDGVSPVYQVVTNAANSRIQVGVATASIAVGQSYAVSTYIQTAAADVAVRAFDGGTGANTSTTVAANTSLTKYSVTRVVGVGATSANLDVLIPTSGTTIYIAFSQLEVGPFPTSYIPTTSASAPRAADVVSLAKGWPSGAGTLLVTTKSAQVTNLATIFDAEVDGSNVHSVNYEISRNGWQMNSQIAGVRTFTADVGSTATKSDKMAYSWDAAGGQFVANGASVVTSAVNMSGLNPAGFTIGALAGGSTTYPPINGYVPLLVLYPVRQSSAQMQAETQ